MKCCIKNIKTEDQEQCCTTVLEDEPPPFEALYCNDDEDDDVDSDRESDCEREDPSAHAIAQTAVHRYASSSVNGNSDRREEDEAEEERISQFVSGGCKCKYGPGSTPCSDNIGTEEYKNVRSQMIELTHDELDLVVLSKLMMSTSSSESNHKNKERQRSHTAFYHGGNHICLNTFIFLHNIGYWRFKALKTHFLVRSLEPRRHGNKGRHRITGLSLTEIEGVVKFISNYTGVY